jgi:hypothetical protein
MRDGVRTDEDLERVDVRGEPARATGDCPIPEPLAHSPQGIRDSGERVGPSSGRRVEDDNVAVREGERAVEAVDQELGDELDLSLDDLRRRVVDTAVLSELRVVGRQEVFVEVEPGVGVPAGQCREIYRGDRALQ